MEFLLPCFTLLHQAGIERYIKLEITNDLHFLDTQIAIAHGIELRLSQDASKGLKERSSCPTKLIDPTSTALR